MHWPLSLPILNWCIELMYCPELVCNFADILSAISVFVSDLRGNPRGLPLQFGV